MKITEFFYFWNNLQIYLNKYYLQAICLNHSNHLSFKINYKIKLKNYKNKALQI